PKTDQRKLTQTLTKLYKILTKKLAHYYSTGYNFTAFKARKCSLAEQSITKNINKTEIYLTG
ncbi:hypothetical protein, partial [Gilliamella sp. Pas-s95]|uniref:hypothetical protein n=1 Tax=Gilliamella sp. Pas-s95 TaxID=2687317 RepID=UPI001F345AD2